MMNVGISVKCVINTVKIELFCQKGDLVFYIMIRSLSPLFNMSIRSRSKIVV